MRDVPHDAVHGACEINLVLIIHGDANKKLRVSYGAANVLPELVAPGHKVVRIAGHGRVSHMRKFHLVSPRQKAMQYRWDLTLQYQFSVDQPNLFLRHLSLPCAPSPFLAAGRCRTITVRFIFWVVLITRARLRLKGFMRLQLWMRICSCSRRPTKHIVTVFIFVFVNRDSGRFSNISRLTSG